MPIQQNFIYGVTDARGANPQTWTVAVQGDGENNRVITLPGGGSVDVEMAWDYTRLKGFVFYSAGVYDLVLNPDTSEEETVPAVGGGYPMIWDHQSGLPYPFENGTVSEVRLVSQQTDEQEVTIRAVIDATPGA